MWGEDAGDATGDNGLGLHHLASGAQKVVAVAPASSASASSEEGALRVVHTGLQVVGARKPSEVGRALAARFGDFAECAKRGSAAPARAVVSFMIDENGAVRSQPPASDGLGACLSREVESVQFERLPQPAGKSYVSYPLFFLRTGQGLAAPRKHAPEACDCGG